MVIDSLNIFMNGMRVGLLQKLHTGELTFLYDSKWLDMPGARPISLSLPLSAEHYQGAVVYNFFDNLLPDNDRIKTRIQALFEHLHSSLLIWIIIICAFGITGVLREIFDVVFQTLAKR